MILVKKGKHSFILFPVYDLSDDDYDLPVLCLNQL
jgi:hypothetical protein